MATITATNDLAPGTRLGLYKIQSPLDACGMGGVYDATNTKARP